MNYKDYFGEAKVLSFPDRYFSINARQDFPVKEGLLDAEINIIGWGYFELYINAKRVGEDLFVPLNSEYHKRYFDLNLIDFDEEFATRAYVEKYNIKDFLTSGKNNLAVMIGNGWYADKNQKVFGNKKLFFRITLTYKDGTEYVYSDESLRYREGYVVDSEFTDGEYLDFRRCPAEWMTADGICKRVPDIAILPETTYMTSDCPRDRIIKTISPVLINEKDGIKTYDIGINTTGRVILKLTGEAGSKVILMHSEEKNDDNTIDNDDCCCWDQISTFISDGTVREVSNFFMWNGMRYFSVEGEAEVLRFERIHTDAKVDSEFHANNKVLNWLYGAFINTQLSNMHSGIPSDCPHLEKRGYTGDGELACNAVMTTIDTEKFYRKWIADISDCQDRKTGHIQNTAPYVHSGGGPGGWGCAVVHVPYMFYKHYGKADIFKDMLPQMLRYFDYLDMHSENDLVTTDRPGEWCLGDWCTAEKIAIPEPFVNTYFYIRSINELLDMKYIIGLDSSTEEKLTDKKEKLISAINKKYFDNSTGHYCNSIQGANAFAVDIGLGDERTYRQLIDFYSKLGMFDTGIFGTDILIRTLFEHGDGELAYKLLTSEGEFSFGRIMNAGSTTLWEYWYGERSHSHPMFGAVTAYLFEYLLGIREENGLPVIAPVYPGKDESFKGKENTKYGEFNVSITYNGNNASFDITVPVNTIFIFGERKKTLSPGTHKFNITK